MSWSVNGHVYHSYEEYQRALARERAKRLRATVERLQIAPADTSRLEREMAAVQARDHAARRLAAQVRREIGERQQQAEHHREAIATAAAEVEDMEGRLLATLDGWRSDLARRIERLDAQREARAAAAAADLERELAADRHDEATARRRGAELLAGAEKVLGGLAAERLRDLGLDATPVRGLLDRARREGDLPGLDLARRAYDQAGALESNAAYREARLEALRGVYAAEIEELQASLVFDAAARADLVGDGGAALDAPLRQELNRVRDRIDAIRGYEDHELRFGDAGRALDHLAVRVSDLASQVRDFERLDEGRLDLVRNRLGAKLAEVLGEQVELTGVEPGALGLQPVEAHFRTGRGEKIDCAVCLDGTLRIHHYEHVSQASCAQSARALTARLPELMALAGEPRLDAAASAVQRDSAPRPAERQQGREGAGDER